MLTQESTVLFDLSTLRENILLDAKQEAFVRATISSTLDLISGLDVKIRDAENALAELQKQRDAAIEAMAIPAALVAPVRRLPLDVLGEIFQRCVPIKPTYLTPFDGRDAPLLLTRVCHRWRQVAQGTPLLWTRLVLHNRIPESFFSSMWLNNSGSAPLDISVEASPHGNSGSGFKYVGDPIDEEYTGHGWRMDRYMVWLWPKCPVYQTSQIVVGQFSRIRRLSLVYMGHQLRDYFRIEPMTTLPSLQELCVESETWQDRRAYSFHNILTPQLQTLVLNYCAELLLPILECTSNLRNLDIRGDCSQDIFVDFISRCPALERIDGSGVYVAYGQESVDMNDIVLPGLSHLALGVRYISDGQFHNELGLDPDRQFGRTKLLQRLRTPNLQSADIRHLLHVGRFLSSCMADSQSKLRTLRILYLDLDTSTFDNANVRFNGC